MKLKLINKGIFELQKSQLKEGNPLIYSTRLITRTILMQ